MERYLFKQPDHQLVEVVATSYVAAQEIAGEDAVCLAVGEDEIAAYDAASFD